MAVNREEQRLQIAVSLLQGQVVELPRDGYDPGGFAHGQVSRRVESALLMAEMLLSANERYQAAEEQQHFEALDIDEEES